MGIMMYLYFRQRYFPLISIITLMSLIIGVVSIQLQYNTFTPWFQVFFIVFQTSFFLKTSIDYMEEKKS